MSRNVIYDFIETLDQIIKDGIRHGIGHHFTEDETLNGRRITNRTQDLLNFGSCSYSGLERHPSLIQGSIQALQNFGTQFSSSRTFVSLGLYAELEELLKAIFEKPVVVMASTSLGHLAALPVLIRSGDAVIIDFQVHASVQMAVQLLKSRGIPIHLVHHNNVSELERKIKNLKTNYRKIWYLADGIYSMHGDAAPLDELMELLNAYEKFYLYIDDAHGMSWAGRNGSGFVRSCIPHHEKMTL